MGRDLRMGHGVLKMLLLKEISDGRRYLQEEEEGNLVSRLRNS